MHSTMLLIRLIAFILIACFGVTTTNAGVLSSVTKFEDFLTILTRIPSKAEKLRFLQAVWGEVRADYSDDLTKANLLYQQFDSLTASKILAESQAAHELQQELRRYLKTKNAALLAKAWNGQEFPNTKELLKFCATLKKNYAVELVHEIYATAIDEIYPHRPADVLAAFFAQIYVHNDEKTFELMFYAQLHLYWKFVHAKDVNDVYLLNMGNYFYQILNDGIFEKSAQDFKRRLTKAIDSLPSTVQIFFFSSGFCLKNKGKLHYLASSGETVIDADRQYVQTVSPESPNNNTLVWLREFARGTGNLNGVPSQKFWLKNPKSYIYREQNWPAHMDLVASWRSNTNIPETRTWTLQMIENNLIFMQNGFVMCASREKIDEYGFLVYGYQDLRYTPTNADCQWIIEEGLKKESNLETKFCTL